MTRGARVGTGVDTRCRRGGAGPRSEPIRTVTTRQETARDRGRRIVRLLPDAAFTPRYAGAHGAGRGRTDLPGRSDRRTVCAAPASAKHARMDPSTRWPRPLEGARRMFLDNMSGVRSKALDARRRASLDPRPRQAHGGWSAVYHSFAFDAAPRSWVDADWPRGLRARIEPPRRTSPGCSRGSRRSSERCVYVIPYPEAREGLRKHFDQIVGAVPPMEADPEGARKRTEALQNWAASRARLHQDRPGRVADAGDCNADAVQLRTRRQLAEAVLALYEKGLAFTPRFLNPAVFEHHEDWFKRDQSARPGARSRS